MGLVKIYIKMLSRIIAKVTQGVRQTEVLSFPIGKMIKAYRLHSAFFAWNNGVPLRLVAR
jgi:hypothetical protein